MAITPFPADDPIWNTGGSNRTTPTSGKQALGWELEEEPPSGYFNWWMFYVSEYIQHYKASVVDLYADKLSKEGGEISGSYTFDFDSVYDIGSNSVRLQALYALEVDAINILPSLNAYGSGIQGKLGNTGRRWQELWVSAIDAFSASIAFLTVDGVSANTVTATTVSTNALNASTVSAANMTATGNVTALRGIVNELVLFRGNRTSVGGVRQLDVSRATVIIDKPANVVLNDATHVKKKSGVASVTSSGTTCTVTLTWAQEDNAYGVEFTGCREIGAGASDLVMIQVFNKTTTTFDFIAYYWSGTNWVAMTMNTVNANAALRGVIRVIGSDA